MGSQWGKDKVYRRAMNEGFRSRAAYKLQEIQERFSIIRDDDNIVDLGAAPGSWLQVERGLTKGKVLGVDLNPIPPIDGVMTVVGDLTTAEVRQQVMELMGVVNVVLCDASPKLSGQKSYDQARAIGLGEDALAFAVQTMKQGGNMAMKSFQGDMFAELLADVRKHFYAVKTFHTKSTRRGSTEIYIVARNFIGSSGDVEGPIQ